MSNSIKDGAGHGFLAKVNSDHRLLVKAVSAELQHTISEEDNESFQLSTSLDITASKQNLLVLKNTHIDRNLVITFLRVETAGAAAVDENAFFTIEVGGSYSSGGTAVTPTNMFVGSAVSPSGEFYEGSGSAIVLGNSFTEIDRTYKKDIIYNKHGSLILPKNSSLLLTHTGSTAAGKAYCRVSFYYDKD